MSPTQTPPVHCQDPRRLIRVPTLRPSPISEGLGCRECVFEAHFCGSYILRPTGSTPCLLSTPPHGDAVGTVCGAEPSNCTDGTFTRVDARFTGAPEITGRPSASQIKATDPKRWAPITDEQLEVQILFILQKEGSAGMNATVIAGKLNQDPVWIRRWIKRHPNVLKRVGAGPGTRFFAPQARSASIH